MKLQMAVKFLEEDGDRVFETSPEALQLVAPTLYEFYEGYPEGFEIEYPAEKIRQLVTLAKFVGQASEADPPVFPDTLDLAGEVGHDSPGYGEFVDSVIKDKLQNEEHPESLPYRGRYSEFFATRNFFLRGGEPEYKADGEHVFALKLYRGEPQEALDRAYTHPDVDLNLAGYLLAEKASEEIIDVYANLDKFETDNDFSRYFFSQRGISRGIERFGRSRSDFEEELKKNLRGIDPNKYIVYGEAVLASLVEGIDMVEADQIRLSVEDEEDYERSLEELRELLRDDPHEDYEQEGDRMTTLYFPTRGMIVSLYRTADDIIFSQPLPCLRVMSDGQDVWATEDFFESVSTGSINWKLCYQRLELPALLVNWQLRGFAYIDCLLGKEEHYTAGESGLGEFVHYLRREEMISAPEVLNMIRRAEESQLEESLPNTLESWFIQFWLSDTITIDH